MSAFALVSGTLFRNPESRIAKSGKPFVIASIKVKDGADAVSWWRVFAFGESAQTELLRLNDGDAVAVQGAMKIETYTARDGATKLSFSVLVDQVLALRQPKKTGRKADDPPPDNRSRQERYTGRAGPGDPSDDIPF